MADVIDAGQSLQTARLILFFSTVYMGSSYIKVLTWVSGTESGVLYRTALFHDVARLRRKKGLIKQWKGKCIYRCIRNK